MKGIYILINQILFVFMLSNFFMVHSLQLEPLAKLWNIDDEQIPEYLNIEKNLSTIDGILKSYLDNDNFGGTYINVIQRKVFINTLNETAAEQIKNRPEIRPYVNSLNFSIASNSTAKLNSGIKDILNLAKRYNPADCLGYTDAKVNNIVIATCVEDRNNTRNAAFLNATKIYYPIYIYYICIPEKNNNTISQNNMKFESRNGIVDYILAGDGLNIYERTTRNSTKCSVGFWAKNRLNPNFNFIATAGHCFRQNAFYYLLPWNSTNENFKYYVGEMIIYYQSPIDFGLISISSNSNVTPVANIRNTDSKKYAQLQIKDNIVVSSNGAHLCISGLRSHVKCGYVKALSGFASTVDEKEFIENLFVVSMYIIEGDSGGPIFSYNQDLIYASLNGILLGSFDYDINGDINNAIIQVQPIDFILNNTAIKVVTVT
ncbi:hypothetical protein C2G38_2032057 [Gigaspora rosea]|uniref:Peptidase S1 domain-containing protein n=1 Tax=Gigaspora rosea TaxID=44941 RepID=A0A397VQL5_9GLOM|nr:hypothetical protein C2G38_2032057 [Gigaspora rosea]